MAETDLESQAHILRCVAEILAVDGFGWLPARALIIYEALDADGQPRLGYATADMSSTDVIGMTRWVEEHAMQTLLYVDE